MSNFQPIEPQPAFPVKEETFIKHDPYDDTPDTPHTGTKRPRSVFGSVPFSDQEARAIRQRLDVGLSRNETMQRPGPGGTRLTYIEGWKVIHDANQIFGFNGWSSQIITLDLRYIDERNGRFCACVGATVRITLRDGATREDRGGGTADNMRSRGDAILKAEKEAVTDATKRALKNFGLRLGLSLYDRQHVRDMNRPTPPAQQQHQQQQQPKAFTHHVNHVRPTSAGPVGASSANPSAVNTPARNTNTRNVNVVEPHTPGASSRTPVSNPLVDVTAKPSPNADTSEKARLAARVAANREQALQRQLALKRERDRTTTTPTRPGLSTGVGGPMGGGNGVTSIRDEVTGVGVGNRHGMTAGGRTESRPGSAVGHGHSPGTGSDPEAKIAQQEIDELSAMALAEF